MKKIVSVCAMVSLLLLLAGCAKGREAKNVEPYTMNASVAYGAVQDDSLDETKVSYQVSVSGAKGEVRGIISQEIVINADYADLLIEDGPHNAQIKGDTQPYLEMSGSFVFDTRGKSKEEIDAMRLIKGVRITDKDGNINLLEFGGK